MHDELPLASKVLRSDFTGILQWLWPCLLSLVGCMHNEYPLEKKTQGYEYFTLSRDKAGNYRNGPPIDQSETAVYNYGFRYVDLLAINPDMKTAVKHFIEMRHAAPPECAQGFIVVNVGRTGNSGVTAGIECNK